MVAGESGVSSPGAGGDLVGVPGTVRRAGGHQVGPAGVAVAVRDRVGVEHHDLADAGGLVDRPAPAGQLVGVLEHDDGRLGVPRDVRHLLGGERVVDRHRGGRGVHGADVANVVLDPVGGHDRHRVAHAHAELDEGGRDVERQVLHLRPGQGPPRLALGQVVLVGVRRPVRVGAHGVRERVDEGPAADLLFDPGAFGEYVVVHGGSSVDGGSDPVAGSLRWLGHV